MIKAVDGGGGRGIRLVREESQLAAAVKRAVEESPSKQVFAEKAAVDGFRHIEVQIIGDGSGDVTHLWERECSIQRRYQKVIEIAPSVVSDRLLIARIINDALRMAQRVSSMAESGNGKTHDVTGPLLLTWNLRVPCEFGDTRALFPGGQPAAPS